MPKRQSIYSETFSHGNPIPAACRVGNLLMTGIINGTIKGETPGEAGPDFTAADVQKAQDIFQAVAPILLETRPDPF